jgi:holo-[acyl-carrier protein] synthase
MTTIGIDVVEIDRIKGLCQRFGERFLNRIFTKEEIAYAYAARGHLRFERLAARFALKEALIKALGHSVPFLKVKITHTKEGRLRVSCTEIEGKIEASLSHTKRLAVACILLEEVTS